MSKTDPKIISQNLKSKTYGKEPEYRKIEHTADFIALLLDLHNTVNLLLIVKRALNDDRTRENLKRYVQTQKLLKSVNDKLSLYLNEYNAVLNLLEQSKRVIAPLLLDSRFTPLSVNLTHLKLSALQHSDTCKYEMLENFENAKLKTA